MKLSRLLSGFLVIVIFFSLSTVSYAKFDTTAAVKMNVGQSITSSLRYARERNIYAIDNASQTTMLKFEYPAEITDASWRIIILANGAYQIINERTSTSDPIIGNKRVHILKKFRTGSLFYVMVTAYGNKFSNAEYTLSATKIPRPEGTVGEWEFTNNTANNCQTVSSGSLINGNLYNMHEHDWYHFKIYEDTDVSLIFKNISGAETDCFNVTLYNYSRNVLAEFNNSKDAQNDITVESLPPGSYFVCLKSSTNYSNDDYILQINY